MKIISRILLLPLAIVVIAFAVANRHDVVVRLDPLPVDLDLPLYAVAFGGVVIGLLVGGLASWLRGGRWRREARVQRRRAKRLEREAGSNPETQAEAADSDDVPRIENAA